MFLTGKGEPGKRMRDVNGEKRFFFHARKLLQSGFLIDFA
jgi:hypothetical protein